MPVTGSVSSSFTAGAQTSLTFSHTSNGDPLYVPLSWYVGSGGTEVADIVTGVTFNGAALTRGGQAAVAGQTMEWWRLASPGTATANIVVTLSSGRRVSAAGVNLSGWPSTLGDHIFASASGDVAATQPSVTIASGTGAEVLDWLGFNNPVNTATPGAGQTEKWNQETLGSGSGAGGDQVSAGSLKAGATSVTMSWTVPSTPETWGLCALSYVPSVSTPVTYEDPCSITEPRIFAKLTTEDETLKFGVQPLRDTTAMGGFAEPRLISVSPVTKVASDPSTGSWSAQTATMVWADTDRANRARSETRTSFRGCDAEIYLTSNAQRLAGLPPRILFAGTVYEDSAAENLTLSQTINDLIGTNYNLFGEEKQIPQRVIEKNWFPDAPDTSLGQAEPIVGGRRAPLDPAALAAIPEPEGVSKGVYVGQVRIGGAHGTPTGTDLATVVAALEASRAAGTLYTLYGSRIGYGDALALQGMGSVPSDYDSLAAVIGYSDLDALLAETSHTGGDVFEAVVIASHAISEILDADDGNPSIWVGDTQVAAADIGVSVWAPQIPGDASWAADISASLFTDIVGADGTTRRYTLILFDPAGAHGIAVAGGAVVHVDCVGLEDVGDGTGAALTDYFDLYRHVLINFVLQDYQSGAWLSSPQFLFSDGSTLLDRVDATSFDTASSVAGLSVSGGFLGSFTIDERVSVRDIIQRFNFSGGCLLAQDDYGQLFVKVLDVRRAPFLLDRFSAETHRTLVDKRDFLLGFRIEAKPDWQVNRLTYQYAKNNYTGSYERDAGGGGNTVFVEDTTSQTRDGVFKKTVEFPYLRDDATADAVANYYLQLFKDLPRVVTYTRRGLCGLEDDLLQGVPITHFNGYGSSGWVDHAVWIIGKTFDPKRMVCTFTALDVESRLVAEETVTLEGLTLDPVALEFLYSDDAGELLTTDV